MELMPWYWKAAHYIFPAAHLLHLPFVKLETQWGQVWLISNLNKNITLWIQVIVYFRTLSIWVYKRKLALTDILFIVATILNNNYSKQPYNIFSQRIMITREIKRFC